MTLEPSDMVTQYPTVIRAQGGATQTDSCGAVHSARARGLDASLLLFVGRMFMDSLPISVVDEHVNP